MSKAVHWQGPGFPASSSHIFAYNMESIGIGIGLLLSHTLRHSEKRCLHALQSDNTIHEFN